MNSAEIPIEVEHPVPQAAGPPSPTDAMDQETMTMLPVVGYSLTDLEPPVSHEPASQSSELISSHPDLAGGIMRIAPAEATVSCVVPCIEMIMVEWNVSISIP